MKFIFSILCLMAYSLSSQAGWEFDRVPNKIEKYFLDQLVTATQSISQTHNAQAKGSISQDDATYIYEMNADSIESTFLYCQSMSRLNRQGFHKCGQNFNKAIKRFRAHAKQGSLSKQLNISQRTVMQALEVINDATYSIKESQQEAKGINSHGVEWVVPTSYAN